MADNWQVQINGELEAEHQLRPYPVVGSRGASPFLSENSRLGGGGGRVSQCGDFDSGRDLRGVKVHFAARWKFRGRVWGRGRRRPD